MTAIIQTRSELIRGDHRILYFGWLLDVQSGKIDDDTLEPPVPPGLGELNAPLECLAEFLLIDRDLIATAAEGSPKARSADITRKEISTWLLNLPAAENDEILARLMDGTDLHLGAALRQRAIASVYGVKKPGTGERRIAGDIIGRRVVLADERRKREDQERAIEKTRREREQAEKRATHLEWLAGKETGLWGNVHEHIATRLPRRYDEAVSLLVDLRDLAAMKGESADFSRRIRALKNEHANKPSLMRKFQAAKLSE